MDFSVSTLPYILIPLLSYLLGSIPFGVIIGKIVAGVDIRRHGSGNIGMANVLRTAGIRAAILVLVLDMSKSVLPMVLSGIVIESPHLKVAAGLAALAGHIWPIFIKFKGGRAAAPGVGALFILSPLSGLITTILAATVIGTTRYVSLGSIIGTMSGSVCLIVLSLTGIEPMANVWFAVIAGSLIIARHRENVLRLVRGQEHRIGQTVNSVDATQTNKRGKGFRWPKLV